MKFLTFRTQTGLQLGVQTAQGVLDVSKAAAVYAPNNKVPQTIEKVFATGKAGLQALTTLVNQAVEAGDATLFHNEADLNIGPCVPNPGKIICVGLNYRKHAAETNMPVPETPILFPKYNNAIAGPEDPITIPNTTAQADYEAELAIVIGTCAKNVSKESALNYAFGYCTANDLSARDLQFRTNQWLLGKSLDGFCPVGPYLVTADEVPNPNNLGIRAYVNGQIRQDSNTSDMVFYCDELISYISHYVTLEPGDIILTGTPEGVIMGYPKDQQTWLQDGDTVTIEIDTLGRLTNHMRQEA